MASMQEKRERAEAAARVAVSELSDDVNRDTRKEHQQRGGGGEQNQETNSRPPSSSSSGVIGSILRTLGFGHAKDAVTGTAPETTEEKEEAASDHKAKEAKDDSVGKIMEEKANNAKETTGGNDKVREVKDKASEYKDNAEDVTKESKDIVEEKAKEAKERAAQRVPEYKAYAVEKLMESKDRGQEKEKLAMENKAKEGKDNFVGKISDTAKRAMDFIIGKKEDISESPKEKYLDPEHETRQKMQELKLEEEGYEDEDRKREAADRETAQDRAIAGKRNIFGMMPSIKDNIKSKFIMPSDIVVAKRARELGGPEKVLEEVVKESQTPAEAAAATTAGRADRK